MSASRTTRGNRDYAPLRKGLRAQMTPAENLLWQRLRAKQFCGLKFRRQHGIGPYIADFFCPEKRVVIEIDGDTHAHSEQIVLDKVREEYLKRLGVVVIRYTNIDVKENVDGVLGDLRRRIVAEEVSTSPLPSLQRRGISLTTLLLSSLLLSSCLSLPQVGEEGQPCSDKGACSEGLVCGSGKICTKAGGASDSGVPQGDGGHDATADAGVDAGTDAAADSGADLGLDGGLDGASDASDASDGGVDAGADTGEDASQDAGQDAGADAGGDAGTGPVITSIDGDGTSATIVDPGGVLSGLPDRLDATHRFQKKWVVTGERLDTVTTAKLEKNGGGAVFTAADGLVLEAIGTAAQRNLLLPVALVTGAFTLTISNLAGVATAQVYVLPGEKGDKGAQGSPGISVTAASEAAGTNCTYGDVKYTSISGIYYACNGEKGGQGIQGIQGTQGIQGPAGTFSGMFTGDVTFTGNMALSGLATLGSLTVQNAYTLPDCPSGYARDSTCAPWAGGCQGIVVCKKGADEMVKVGDFWIDRYESSIVDTTQYAGGNCSGAGSPYGQSAYDYPGSFPRTGNYTAPMYACSLKSVKPSYMTWFQAQEACALSGKQLCTNEEWQAAAAGTYDTTGTETGGQCHIATGNTSARNTGLAGSNPAGTDSCISKWGTEDMVGNLLEWVSIWGQAGPDHGVADGAYAGNVTSNNGFAGFSPETSGDGDGTWNVAGTAYGCDRTGLNCGYKVGLPFAALRGGHWPDGPLAGVFALNLRTGPSYANIDIGARCCRQR